MGAAEADDVADVFVGEAAGHAAGFAEDWPVVKVKAAASAGSVSSGAMHPRRASHQHHSAGLAECGCRLG